MKFANNKAEWDAVTGGNDGLIAVQISTKTCGPCKVIYPTFVGLSEEFAEKATFVKIMGDTDTESRALMKEWGVRVVPLFMLWKNGEKIEWRETLLICGGSEFASATAAAGGRSGRAG